VSSSWQGRLLLLQAQRVRISSWHLLPSAASAVPAGPSSTRLRKRWAVE
jgi:hypothetical protein